MLEFIYIVTVRSLFFLLFYHYLLFLSIEISIKISKISSSSSKTRVKIYHVFSFALSMLISFIVYYFSDFGEDFLKQSLYSNPAYQFLVYYIAATTLLLLTYLGIYSKSILSYKSTEFRSLISATIVVCICNIIGLIIPQILSDSGYSDGEVYYASSECFILGSGFLSSLTRLLNKDFIQLFKLGRKSKNRLIFKRDFKGLNREMSSVEEDVIISYTKVEPMLISEVLEDIQKRVASK